MLINIKTTIFAPNATNKPTLTGQPRFASKTQNPSDFFEPRFGARKGKRALIDLDFNELNKLDVVKKSFDPSKDINEVKYEQTVLHKFLQHPEPNEAVYKYLKAKGIDLKAKGQFGGTAIHSLIHENEKPNLNILQDLISSGVEINSKDSKGYTAFHRFLQTPNPNMEAVKAFLSLKIDINTKDTAGMTALHYTLSHKYPNEEVVKLLRDKGIDKSSKDQSGKTALELYKHIHPNNVETFESLTEVLYPKAIKPLQKERTQQRIIVRLFNRIRGMLKIAFEKLKHLFCKVFK